MMRWKILRIGETEIDLHPAVIVYLVYSAITGHLAFILTAFASIILHEAAHGLASALLGQRPASIEITPLGAVMCLEDESKLSPFKRVLMILAGPGVTFLLCWMSSTAAVQGYISMQMGRTLFLSNLSILILNLLPVLPLDGGRLLALLLESILPKSAAVKVMKGISITAGLGLILLNVVYSWRNGGWNLSLAFAGCCILYSTAALTVTQAMAEMRYFLDRKIVLERKQQMQTIWMTALQTTPVRRLVKALPARQMIMCVCVEAGTGKMLGIIHESELIQQYLDCPGILLSEAITAAKNRYDFSKSDTI